MSSNFETSLPLVFTDIPYSDFLDSRICEENDQISDSFFYQWIARKCHGSREIILSELYYVSLVEQFVFVFAVNINEKKAGTTRNLATFCFFFNLLSIFLAFLLINQRFQHYIRRNPLRYQGVFSLFFLKKLNVCMI